jgi:hypothetical protein
MNLKHPYVFLSLTDARHSAFNDMMALGVLKLSRIDGLNAWVLFQADVPRIAHLCFWDNHNGTWDYAWREEQDGPLASGCPFLQEAPVQNQEWRDATYFRSYAISRNGIRLNRYPLTLDEAYIAKYKFSKPTEVQVQDL